MKTIFETQDGEQHETQDGEQHETQELAAEQEKSLALKGCLLAAFPGWDTGVAGSSPGAGDMAKYLLRNWIFVRGLVEEESSSGEGHEPRE